MPTLPVTKKIFRCPHCYNEVPMNCINSFSGKKISFIGSNAQEIARCMAELGRTGELPPNTKEYFLPEKFTAYQCPTCNDVVIIKSTYQNLTLEMIQEDQSLSEGIQKIIYPNNKTLDENIIPLKICEIYSEAISLKKLSPSSFGVQIRKVLELLCEEQGAPKSGDLYNKLEKLSERNIFPENIINMGNIIRKVAKYGAHPKDEEITASDADLLDDIFHLILDYVYITPYKVKTLEDKFKKVNK